MVNARPFIPDRHFRPRAGSDSKPRQRHGSRLQRFVQRLRTWFMTQTRSKRTFFAAILIFVGLFCILILEPQKAGPRLTFRSYNPSGWKRKMDEEFQSVKGFPTVMFRENLRNDTTYITSWSNAGFTNQFMGYVNMIYLATLTDRVPIIPPFAPDHHISSTAGIIPFGDLFDLDYLRKELRIPILEWRDVKAVPSRYSANPYSGAKVEKLGCWTTRKENEGNPIRAENIVHHLGLDVSYTRVPTYTRLDPSNPDDPHVVFSHLSALTYPRDPIASPESFRTLAPSPLGHWDTPETQLSCFDTLYYVSSGSRAFEWQYSWSPVWRTVGRHMHFTQDIQDLGMQYLAKVFGLTKSKEIPPFIIVHIRRGDFAAYCSQGGRTDCFPPLSVYKKHVESMKTELMTKRSIPITDVLVVSDETSSYFWANVRKQGWLYINHTEERTFERFGEWYPPLLDIVVQSYAIGFVGTEDSTFSLVGQRRVQDWNGGLTRDVSVQQGH